MKNRIVRAKIKITFVVAFVACCALRLLAGSEPEISDRSPDKKYALWQQYADKQPYLGDVKLIDCKTREPVLTFDEQVEPFSKKLLWAKDSRRLAYFNDANQDEGGFTKIFFRDETTFKEATLPDLAAPPLPTTAANTNNSKTRTRVEPLRWTDHGDLILEKEIISKDWGRAALEITIAFDQQHQATVAKSEPEPSSVVDYMLLLPSDTFEGPAANWLYVMRANGNTIDKKNGYMSCPGDGAQPEFELALFRYRDGRPLLAFCAGELEGEDSVSLRFYELGGNGKMQPIDRWLFPVPDGGYDRETASTKANWKFKVPQTGKTITIQSPDGKKILYKLTWNGERFERSK